MCKSAIRAYKRSPLSSIELGDCQLGGEGYTAGLLILSLDVREE